MRWSILLLASLFGLSHGHGVPDSPLPPPDEDEASSVLRTCIDPEMQGKFASLRKCVDYHRGYEALADRVRERLLKSYSVYKVSLSVSEV